MVMNVPIAYLMKVSTKLGSRRPHRLGLEGRAQHFQVNKTAKLKNSWSTVEVNKNPTKTCVHIKFLLILWEMQV